MFFSGLFGSTSTLVAWSLVGLSQGCTENSHLFQVIRWIVEYGAVVAKQNVVTERDFVGDAENHIFCEQIRRLAPVATN